MAKRQRSEQARDAPRPKRRKKEASSEVSPDETPTERVKRYAPEMLAFIVMYVTNNILTRDKAFTKKFKSYISVNKQSPLIAQACNEIIKLFAKAKLGNDDKIAAFTALTAEEQQEQTKKYLSGRARKFCLPLVLDAWVPFINAEFGHDIARYREVWDDLERQSVRMDRGSTTLFSAGWLKPAQWEAANVPSALFEQSSVPREQYDGVVQELNAERQRTKSLEKRLAEAEARLVELNKYREMSQPVQDVAPSNYMSTTDEASPMFMLPLPQYANSGSVSDRSYSSSWSDTVSSSAVDDSALFAGVSPSVGAIPPPVLDPHHHGFDMF